jgi:hypothetical protein
MLDPRPGLDVPSIRFARHMPVETLLCARQKFRVGGPDLQDQSLPALANTSKARAGDATVGAAFHALYAGGD